MTEIIEMNGKDLRITKEQMYILMKYKRR